MKSFLVLTLVSLLSAVSSAADSPAPEKTSLSFAEGDRVVVKLRNKELVMGTVKSQTERVVILQSDLLGEIAVPLAEIESSETLREGVEYASEITMKPKPKIWSGNIDAGINGSEGNSPNLSLRAAGLAERKTEKNRLKFETVYNLDYKKDDTTQNKEKSGNRLTFDARSEWPFPRLKQLNVFVAGSVEYDEFKEFDVRLAGNGGLGMDFVRKEKIVFAGHLGAGVSREFGGPNDEIVPEGVAGLNVDYEPFELQKISASTEIFPELKDLGEFRAVNKVSWNIFLSKRKTFSFGVGLEHRYDSTPGTAKANDLDYFAKFGWNF